MAPKKNDKTNKTSEQTEASSPPASSPPPAKMDLSIDIADPNHKSPAVSSFPLGPSGSDLTNGISISLHGLTLDLVERRLCGPLFKKSCCGARKQEANQLRGQ